MLKQVIKSYLIHNQLSNSIQYVRTRWQPHPMDFTFSTVGGRMVGGPITTMREAAAVRGIESLLIIWLWLLHQLSHHPFCPIFQDRYHHSSLTTSFSPSFSWTVVLTLTLVLTVLSTIGSYSRSSEFSVKACAISALVSSDHSKGII